jgi:hypothetical protein
MEGGVVVPPTFALVATFRHLSQVSLVAAPPSGTYAPAVLIDHGTQNPTGASCQFTPTQGVHVNVLGTGGFGTIHGKTLDRNLVDKVFEGATLTLALQLNRKNPPFVGSGEAGLFIGNEKVDAFPFEFKNFTPSNHILHIRVGIGTRDGTEYRVSVDLLDFQIWVPAQL